MPVHISDSAIYRSSWATPELRALFDDTALTAGWIEVMVVLAETEAEFGLIPAAAARQLADTCSVVSLDEAFFTEVREDFERPTTRCSVSFARFSAAAQPTAGSGFVTGRRCRTSRIRIQLGFW